MDKSEFMRMQLVKNAGIVLDDKPKHIEPAPNAEPAQHVVTDDERELIRQVIVAAGAPESDVEWLVASCPSLEHACGYRPPRPYAYCLKCKDPRPVDPELGCIVCAAIAAEDATNEVTRPTKGQAK